MIDYLFNNPAMQCMWRLQMHVGIFKVPSINPNVNIVTTRVRQSGSFVLIDIYVGQPACLHSVRHTECEIALD